MPLEIRLLGSADAAVLDRVDDDVFDGPILPATTHEFLTGERHHLIVAVDDGVVIGMVSALDYVHPDKPRQLWVNELGVAGPHRRRGIGRKLLQAMLDHERTLGCTEAWVATETHNAPALALYADVGGVPEDCVFFLLPIPPTR